jgi:hypothetical protein
VLQTSALGLPAFIDEQGFQSFTDTWVASAVAHPSHRAQIVYVVPSDPEQAKRAQGELRKPCIFLQDAETAPISIALQRFPTPEPEPVF